MKPPVGLDEICEVYGDPYALMGSDGVMDPPELHEWESRLTFVPFPEPVPLAWAPLQKVSRIRCHSAAAEAFRSVFRVLYAEDALWLAVKTYGGCYTFRTKRASGEDLSTHAWGIAIDLNPSTNRMGALGDISPGIVQVFEAHGFTWGGRWRNPDPMHFQLASGY